MRHLFKFFIMLSALSTVLVGCEKNVVEGNAITFDVQMAGAAESVQDAQTKAAGLFKDSNLNSLGQFQVTAYDGSTKDIDNRTVKRFNSGIWGFEDSPTVWFDGHTRTFWASANLPSYVTVTPNSSSQATISVSAMPSAVGDQWDPLIGYYKGTGNAGKATIIFYHPFTAVSFKTGNMGDSKYNITGIKSVTMKNVHKGGTATTANCSSFNWSPSGTVNVTGGFTGTASTIPFILIPQNLSTNNVSLEITVTRSSGGDKVMYATLKSGSWAAGKLNIYTLDYNNDTMEATLTVTLDSWDRTLDTTPFEAHFD